MGTIASTTIGCTSTKLAVGTDRWEGMAYLLTPCCGATGKGDADASTNVVCRACGAQTSALFGMAYTGELDGLRADLLRLNTALGCPCPEECAHFMAYKAHEALKG